MKHFTNLSAWSNGLNAVEEIYQLTKQFPKEELFGLTSQLKRSSTSILANIAEGFGRFTYPDKAAKYTISRGETLEAEAHILVAVRLGFVTQSEAEKSLQLLHTEYKILSGLIAACRKSS
jgi:four helix bundle protein